VLVSNRDEHWTGLGLDQDWIFLDINRIESNIWTGPPD